MTIILALLQPIQNSVSQTTMRQLNLIFIAMLAMMGWGMMPGLSRWTKARRQLLQIGTFPIHSHPLGASILEVPSSSSMQSQDTFLLIGDESLLTKV